MRSRRSESHELRRLLSVLWVLHSTYSRDADREVNFLRNLKNSILLLHPGLFYLNFPDTLMNTDNEYFYFRNDGTDDHYSVLIRFDDQNSADSFYRYFNQRCFSSLEVRVQIYVQLICYFPSSAQKKYSSL